MDDAFVAFWSGVGCGMIVGIFMFSVVLAIRMNEFKRENERKVQEYDDEWTGNRTTEM